jgi:transposase
MRRCLAAQGETAAWLGQCLGRHEFHRRGQGGRDERQSLGDAVKRYNAEGVDGLKDRPRSGRKRKLDASQEQELAGIVRTGPDPEQDGISAYTLGDLCAIARERFGVSYGATGMSAVLHRLGFSRQKARPHHPKKDEAAQAAFKGALLTG